MARREDFNISYKGVNPALPIRSWDEANLPKSLMKVRLVKLVLNKNRGTIKSRRAGPHDGREASTHTCAHLHTHTHTREAGGPAKGAAS